MSWGRVRVSFLFSFDLKKILVLLLRMPHLDAHLDREEQTRP
jgi:hypothetical protein